ncbi:MAG: hypothetical protein VKQ33_04300 [Candidatus Sericytochromatia bacterium]|nr:hypothetical protein [Candidatus Sericytochromatia bacterium]
MNLLLTLLAAAAIALAGAPALACDDPDCPHPKPPKPPKAALEG